MTGNKAIIKRIGEQKTTLNNLIKLLTPYYSKPDFTSLVDNLIELDEIYQDVKITYTFIKPTVDAANKTTTINSTSQVDISIDQLKTITEKVVQIRKDIIN